MKNTLFIIYIVFLPIVCSCQRLENDYKNISDNYLESLFTPNGYYVDVIVPIDKDEFAVLMVTTLFYLYEQHYSSLYSESFDFLRALYNGEIQDINQYIPDHTKEKSDQAVMDEYGKYGLGYIINKYLTKTGSTYAFKNMINFTVLKIMFMNNYYLYFDDHIAAFTFQLELDDLAIPE